MPVQLFSFDYPPLSGGIARLSSGLASGLAERGHEVEVITQVAGGRENSQDSGSLRHFRVTRARPLREIRAGRHLRLRDPEGVLICGGWYPEGLTACIAGARDFVVLAHGAELLPRGRGLRAGLWSWWRDRVLARAGLVVANSDYTRSLALRGGDNRSVAVVTPGVDAGQFSPGDGAAARRRLEIEPGKLVLSTVSRLRAFKGHETVYRALAQVPDEARMSFVYLVAGSGPDEAALRSRAGELGVGSLVRWLGHVPESRLADLYRASDLFLLCTREAEEQRQVEGFGLVLLEAQACGVPVVATRTGGIPDAVREGGGGWLIDEGDAARLSEILSDLVRDPELFHEAGRQARKRIEREATLEGYIDRFEAALAAGGQPLA